MARGIPTGDCTFRGPLWSNTHMIAEGIFKCITSHCGPRGLGTRRALKPNGANGKKDLLVHTDVRELRGALGDRSACCGGGEGWGASVGL